MKYFPLGDLILWPRNYRVGQVDAIVKSIEKFGFNTAVRVRESNGQVTVYAGNHSIKALLAMKAAGATPPIGVGKTFDHDWSIPCIDISHLSDSEAMAFAIADNRLQELGENDLDKLNELLLELQAIDIDLLLTAGFTEFDIPAAVNEEQAESTGTEFLDRAAELQEKWQVQRGDLYEIGDHRIMCGDSESIADVDRLLPDEYLMEEREVLMVTDPPYGVKYDSAWRAEYSSGEYSSGTIANDDRADWSQVYKLWNPRVLYVWHSGLHSSEVQRSIEAAGYEVRAQIIWNKSSMVFGRGHYHWKHEPCWYAVRDGSTGNWQGDRTQTTVWDCGNGSGAGRTDDATDDFHAGHISQKPVELFRRAILNHTERSEMVVDPFAGSGSCIIACELTKRICRAMELEPKFVAAILERCTELGLQVSKL